MKKDVDMMVATTGISREYATSLLEAAGRDANKALDDYFEEQAKCAQLTTEAKKEQAVPSKSKEDIAPTASSKPTEEEERPRGCCICLELQPSKKKYGLTTCGHILCLPCSEEYKKRCRAASKSAPIPCPECKQHINPVLSRIYF